MLGLGSGHDPRAGVHRQRGRANAGQAETDVGRGPAQADDYIAQHKPRSVLGLPITRQGKLMGVLHLENSLVSGAFIPSKLAVLKLLASQAAISLETARLYADLQRENAERGRAEEQAHLLNRQLG